MTKIIHIADIQIEIRNNNGRLHEFQTVLDNFISDVKREEPDYLCITGDIFEHWNPLSEEKKLFISFLHQLKNIVKNKVLITNGNHDVKQQDNYRIEKGKKVPLVDDIEIIVSAINDDKIQYLNDSTFYTFDDKFVFAVWNHKNKYHSYLRKKYSPWETKHPLNYIKNEEDKTKTYIELFHDPVDGCRDFLDRDVRITKKNKLNDFNGDLVLMGDIHKPDVLNNEKGVKLTYCSSLVARNFSEGDYYYNDICTQEGNEEHGYNLITFDNNNDYTIQFVPVVNPYSYHTIIITEDFDYDNITLDINETEYNRIKIKPRHELSKYQPEKLQKYVFDTFGVTPIIIKDDLIYEQEVQEDIADKDFLDKIKSVDFQRKIMVEHLEVNGFSEEQIKKIVHYDNEVNKKLKIEDKPYIKLNIEKVVINNFKQFSDNQVFKFDTKGIIKINGKNETGKTTLTEAIKTALTGASHNTVKYWDYTKKNKSKIGLNKLINDSRKKDTSGIDLYCSINGKKHIISYLIDRQWKKDEPVYFIDKNEQVNTYIKDLNLSVQVKIKDNGKFVPVEGDPIEYIIDKVPNYIDYVNLVETNSDTLNDLIKLKDDELVEYILRNLGVGFAEQKKEIFLNDVKKRLTLSTDIKDKEVKTLREKIKQIDELIDKNQKLYQQETNNLNNLINKITEAQKNKEENIKKLLPVDRNKLFSNIEEIKNNIHTIIVEVDSYQDRKVSLKNQIDSFTSQYDKNEHDSIKNRVKDFAEWKKTQEENIQIYTDQIKELNQLNIDLEHEKNDYHDNSLVKFKEIISKLDTNITLYENKIENLERDIKDIYKTEEERLNKIINEHTTKIASFNNEIEKIDITLKSLIENRDRLEESKICSVVGCGKLKSKEEVETIQKSIDNKTKQIEENEVRLENIKDSLESEQILLEATNIALKDIETSTYKLSEESLLLLVKVKQELKDSINKKQEIEQQYQDFINGKLEQSVFDKYNEKINNYINRIQINTDKINTNHNKIDNITVTVAERTKEYENTLYRLSELDRLFTEKDRIEAIKYEHDVLIPEKIKVLDNKIHELQNQIDEYNEELKKEEKNKVINNIIKLIENEISLTTKDKEAKQTYVHQLDIEKHNHLNNKENIEKRLNQYFEYKKQQDLFRVYSNLMDKKGIPQIIFKKIVPTINKELSSILEGLNFKLYFDTNNTLKMIDLHSINRTERELEEGSGMERTFAIPAIKTVIRKYNNRFGTNFILLDEITGKLDDRNKDLMVKVLHKLKETVDYVLLIDQNILNMEKLLPEVEINLERTDNGTLILE